MEWPWRCAISWVAGCSDFACRHAEQQIPDLAWRWGVGNTEVWGKNSVTEFSGIH